MNRLVDNEYAYLDLIEYALQHGVAKHDRTGVGTVSVFGPQLRLDLQTGFPLLTTKRVNWNACWAELRWMLRGHTNVNALQAKIWDSWADPDGDLGPVYGRQWRDWVGLGDDPDEPGSGGELVRVDQLDEAERRLRDSPDDRRIIVSAWNVAQLHRMQLPPCHLLFQFYTYEQGLPDRQGVQRVLCTHVYQRSADLFIGVPFNVAGYAALTHLMAKRVGMQAGHLVFSYGDAHVYRDHEHAVEKQLSRTPDRPPELVVSDDVASMNGWSSVSEYHLGLRGYDPQPAIRASVAV